MPRFSTVMRQWASSVAEPHRFKMDWDSPFGSSKKSAKRPGTPRVGPAEPSPPPSAAGVRRNGMVLDVFPSTELAPHDSPNMAAAASTELAPIVEEDRTGLSIAPHLAVKVQLRIPDPRLRTVYSREYVSSAGFQPTERVCRGLLRRIEHCSEELITRKDSAALDQRDPRERRKALRFEMTFNIVRQPGGPWVERTFRSYQKQPLTEEFATEIVLSMHRMVGIFLRHHDKAFRWTKEPSTDHVFGNLTSVALSLGDPMALSCIPPSRFIEATQAFQFVPGYSVEIAFASHCRVRKRYEWSRTAKIKSGQAAPLTLARGENLLWDAHRVVENLLDRKKQIFDLEHQSCDWLEGPADCEHFEDDALRIDLRITNNLGPSHKHLARNTSTRLSLFRDPDGEDCQSFLREVQRGLEDARDKADLQISRMNDFELRILELRGPDWKAERPARFCLDGRASYSQRSIGAILDRVQTGIGDVLRGRKVSIHITAFKRGHLILDKALVARSEGEEPEPLGFGDPLVERDAIIRLLTHRIQQDLDRITRDTCSIDDLPEDEPAVPAPAAPSRAAPAPPSAEAFAARTILEPLFDFELAGKVIGEQVERLNRVSSPPRSPASPPVVVNNRFPTEPADAPSRPQRVFPLVPTKFGSSRSRSDSSSTVTPSDISETPGTPKPLEIKTHGAGVSSPSSCKSPRSPGPNYVISDEGITVVQPEENEGNDDKKSFYSEASSDDEDDESGRAQPSVTNPTATTTPLPEQVPIATAPLGEGAVSTPTSPGAPAFVNFHRPLKPKPEVAADQEEVQLSNLARQSTPTGRPVPNRDHPAPSDESAPSTPALSFGGDPSPRGSMLITPTHLRNTSGMPLDHIVKTAEDMDGAGSNRTSSESRSAALKADQLPSSAVVVAASAAASSEQRKSKSLTDSPTLGRQMLSARETPDQQNSTELPPSEDRNAEEDQVEIHLTMKPDGKSELAVAAVAASGSPVLLSPEDEFSRTKAIFDFDDDEAASRPLTAVSDSQGSSSAQPCGSQEPTLKAPEAVTPPQPTGPLYETRHYPVLSETQDVPEPMCGWLEYVSEEITPVDEGDAQQVELGDSAVVETTSVASKSPSTHDTPVMAQVIETDSALPSAILSPILEEDTVAEQVDSTLVRALSPVFEEEAQHSPGEDVTSITPIKEAAPVKDVETHVPVEDAVPFAPGEDAVTPPVAVEHDAAPASGGAALAVQETAACDSEQELLHVPESASLPRSEASIEIEHKPIESEALLAPVKGQLPTLQQDDTLIVAEGEDVTAEKRVYPHANEQALLALEGSAPTTGALSASHCAVDEPDVNVFDHEFASDAALNGGGAGVAVGEEPLVLPSELREFEELTQALRNKRSLPPLNPLLVARDSTSSWEDYNSQCTRDSVDTIHTDEDDSSEGGAPVTPARPPSPTRRRSLPLAGILGLQQETRRVEFGLRGTLVGSHLFDHVDSTTYSHGSQRSYYSSIARPRSSATDATIRASSRAGSSPAPRTPTTSSSGAPGGAPLTSPSVTSRLHIRKRATSVSRVAKVKGGSTSSSSVKSPRLRTKSTSALVDERLRREDSTPAAAEPERQEKGSSHEKGVLPRFMSMFSGIVHKT